MHIRSISLRIATAFILFTIAHAADDKSPDLTRLKDQYTKAIQTATEPINKKYIQELTLLQQRYTKQGNLDAALSVKAEIESLSSESPQSAATTSKSKHIRYRYEFVGDKCELPEAIERAKTAGGIVAMVKTEAERQELSSLAAKHGAGQILLGATRPASVDGDWTCTDGTILDKKFASQIGFLTDPSRTGLRLGDSSALNAINSSGKLPFIIAIPK